jgi:hypothetical protein
VGSLDKAVTGGIDNNGPMTITGSTISGNSTKGPSASGGSIGGGIFNANSLTMNNCTVSGNRTDLNSGRGGGIYNNGGVTMTLTNCTITGNAATNLNFENGQGVHTSGTANIRNTIIAGNSTNGPDVSGNFNSPSFNIVGSADGGSSGFTNGVSGNQVGTTGSPIDPMLAALASNGGPTQTHRLIIGSPALDAGDNTVATNAGLTTDQRGLPRIADGPNADTTATVDTGAFELQLQMEDIADRATNEDTTLTFSFNIGDTTLINATATATSNNQTLVPDANVIVTGTGSSIRTLQITPTANLSGTATITVNVNDGTLNMTDSFVLTVNPVNDAPTLAPIGNLILSEDASAQTVNLSGITAGVGESQALTVNATSSNPALIPHPSVDYFSPNSTGSGSER